jgi:hypothetical protein
MPQPLERGFLAFFEDVTVDEFSQYSPGAKDHFSIRLGKRVHAGGVLEERRLVATYLKAGADETNRDIEEFEGYLEQAGPGRVIYLERRDAQDGADRVRNDSGLAEEDDSISRRRRG